MGIFAKNDEQVPAESAEGAPANEAPKSEALPEGKAPSEKDETKTDPAPEGEGDGEGKPKTETEPDEEQDAKNEARYEEEAKQDASQPASINDRAGRHSMTEAPVPVDNSEEERG